MLQPTRVGKTFRLSFDLNAKRCIQDKFGYKLHRINQEAEIVGPQWHPREWAPCNYRQSRHHLRVTQSRIRRFFETVNSVHKNHYSERRKRYTLVIPISYFFVLPVLELWSTSRRIKTYRYKLYGLLSLLVEWMLNIGPSLLENVSPSHFGITSLRTPAKCRFSCLQVRRLGWRKHSKKPNEAIHACKGVRCLGRIKHSCTLARAW